MKIGLIITHGSNEHPCWKQDDGRCSQACPNYVTDEGFKVGEAVTLGRPIKPLHCAVLGGENPDISELEDF